MAYSDVQTAMAAAAADLAAGDYAAALDHAIAAQGYLAALPDGGAADHTMQWDSRKIQDFVANLRRRAGANAGIQRTKITYARITND